MLRAEASSHRTAWRAHYGMPRNDPRNLAATDEDVLEDLAIIGFVGWDEFERIRPAQAEIERQKRNPERAAEYRRQITQPIDAVERHIKRIRRAGEGLRLPPTTPPIDI